MQAFFIGLGDYKVAAITFVESSPKRLDSHRRILKNGVNAADNMGNR